MEKQIFYWKRSKYVTAALPIILTVGIPLYELNLEAAKEFVTNYPTFILGSFKELSTQFPIRSVFFSLTFLISAFHLIRRLLFPELVFSDRSLKFYDVVRNSKRTSVYALDIDTIVEKLSVSTKSGKVVEKPTFIIKTKTGDEYKYSPGVNVGERVDEIKKFLRSCPGIPPIKSGNEKKRHPVI